MVIRSNHEAMNSNRMLGLTVSNLAKSTEKLASGYRVNRSADDAAGLAISEKMRRQIRGLTRASENAQDGISFCQIADGALHEVHDMIKRCEQLATQAANGTNTDTDREYLQQEVEAITQEIDRVHTTSVFNEMRVFTDVGVIPDSNGNIPDSRPSANSFTMDMGDGKTITFEVVSTEGTAIPVAASEATGTPNSDAKKNSALAAFAVDAAASAVGKLAAAYPHLFQASSHTINIGLDLRNKDGAGNTLAFVELGVQGNSTSTVMTYRMLIDTSDYPIESFDSFSDGKKADLAATIAHEMTHAVMFDTLTNGMLGDFPKWFTEGMAQTSSGDNGWVWPGDRGTGIKADSSDADIKNYMAKLSSMPYGAGYLATMYLGYKIAGRDSSDLSAMNAGTMSTQIKTGLDSLLTSMTGLSELNHKKTLDEAIKSHGFEGGLSAFESEFKSGSPEALAFVKRLLELKGTDGAGSLLASDLSVTEASAFSALGSGNGNYLVHADSPFYSNAFGTGYEFPDNPGDGGGGSGNDRDQLYLQLGTEAGQGMYVKQFNASADALFGFGHVLDVSTVEGAGNSIDYIKEAETRVSAIRSYYGATQNRLEHTVDNLNNVIENTTAAESRIRDTDMAKEMVQYSNLNILSQAGTSMLSQANQKSQMILSLLQ